MSAFYVGLAFVATLAVAFLALEVVMQLAVSRSRWPAVSVGGHIAALVVSAVVALLCAASVADV